VRSRGGESGDDGGDPALSWSEECPVREGSENTVESLCCGEEDGSEEDRSSSALMGDLGALSAVVDAWMVKSGSMI
jgi:hypothetical protein